jgi:hypothetical protein
MSASTKAGPRTARSSGQKAAGAVQGAGRLAECEAVSRANLGSSGLAARPRQTSWQMSSAVAPRHEIQRGSAHLFDGGPREAHVGKQPIIKCEKFLVLPSSIPSAHYSSQPPKRNLPPSNVRKRQRRGADGASRIGSRAAARHVSPPYWSETTLGCGSSSGGCQCPE